MAPPAKTDSVASKRLIGATVCSESRSRVAQSVRWRAGASRTLLVRKSRFALSWSNTSSIENRRTQLGGQLDRERQSVKAMTELRYESEIESTIRYGVARSMEKQLDCFGFDERFW